METPSQYLSITILLPFFKSWPQFLFLCPRRPALGFFLVPTSLFLEFFAASGNCVMGQGLWNWLSWHEAPLCRQRSLSCLCWRRLPPSPLLNMDCLNAACNSQSHSLASETVWETVVCPFPRKENIHSYSTRLFRSFGNCFLKPEVESGWVEGWGRSLMLTWGCVTLFRCVSFLWSSSLLYFLLCSVEAADQVGKERTILVCSYLKPHVANKGSSTGLLKAH